MDELRIINLECAEKAASVITYGVGYNWFDALGIGGGYAREEKLYPLSDKVYPEISDKAGWEAIIEGLNVLRPGIIRFGLPPDPVIGKQPGSINTESVHFKRLERVARWAEKNGCTILLDTFFIPEKYEFPVPKDAHRPFVNMAAQDNRRYAREFVLPLLRHVVSELGLSAVRFFNPVNEPSFTGGIYQTPSNEPNPYAHYVEMYKEMKEVIGSDSNLSGKIGLVGVDCIEADSFPKDKFDELGIDIDPYVDLYSVHYYFHQFDWAPPCQHTRTVALSETMDKNTAKLVSWCRSKGKGLLAAELGSGYFGWFEKYGWGDSAGLSRHEASLLTAEATLRGLNAGLCGVAYWSLLNPDTIDGSWSIMAVEEGKLIKRGHKWHTYSLLSRFIRPGDKCFPLLLMNNENAGEQHLHGSFFLRKNARVYMVINDDWCNRKRIKLRLASGTEFSSVTKVVKDCVRMGDVRTNPKITKDKNGIYIEDIITPMSLNIYEGRK